MCNRTKILVDCVGPVCSALTIALSLSIFESVQYRLYGEPVVQACLAARTHYIDICGEPQVKRRAVNRFSDRTRSSISKLCNFGTMIKLESAKSLLSAVADSILWSLIWAWRLFDKNVNERVSVRTSQSIGKALLSLVGLEVALIESYLSMHFGQTTVWMKHLRSLRFFSVACFRVV